MICVSIILLGIGSILKDETAKKGMNWTGMLVGILALLFITGRRILKTRLP